MSDNPFDPKVWRAVDLFSDLTDITYHRHVDDATVRVAFNRPEVRNAFRCTKYSTTPGCPPTSVWCC